MALTAGAEGAPACSHATATPIRTTSPAPSPNVFIAPPRYRVCRMPLQDRGFSRAGGARAEKWYATLCGGSWAGRGRRCAAAATLCIGVLAILATLGAIYPPVYTVSRCETLTRMPGRAVTSRGDA